MHLQGARSRLSGVVSSSRQILHYLIAMGARSGTVDISSDVLMDACILSRGCLVFLGIMCSMVLSSMSSSILFIN